MAARRSIADLAEVARELTGRSVQEVVHRHPGGLAIVVAPEETERAEDVDPVAVRQILAQLRLQFTHVVVDCGSRLDEVAAAALEIADEAVLVVTPDIVAVRAGRRALTMWERFGLRRSEAAKVLVNRVSRKSEVQPELVRQILPAPVVAQVPADFAALEPAINTGLLSGRRGSVHAAVGRAAVAIGLREAPPVRRTANGSKRQRPKKVAAGQVPADGGQAVTELPMLVLLFGIAVFACLQMVVWGVSHLFAQHAALEVARAAAVSTQQVDLDAAADKALPLGWNSGWTVTRGVDTVSVQVRTPTIVPLLGGPALDVTSTAHVEVEPQ